MKKMKKKLCLAIILAGLFGINTAFASIVITVNKTDGAGVGKKIGTVKADDTTYGLLLTPNLHSLPPGTHGFHIHDLPFCGHHGKEASGHLDPEKTNKHRGPYEGSGHLGDLPVLIVDKKGEATLPVLAPRLKLSDIKNRALMIHAGSDNYSDIPKPLGGGGDRMACGVINYF